MYPKRLIPLVIVGRQRAGTRFLTNVLNSFDRVCVQGEVPNPVMQLADDFVRQVDAHYETARRQGGTKSDGEYAGWRKKREDLIFSIWEHAGQSKRQVLTEKTRYFGYKRPNNEHYFAFYEQFFTNRKPRYVYCVRNFEDNYLSIVSRWPERSIEEVGADYLQSLAQFELMKKEAAERVMVFNLDEFSELGLAYLRRNIFRPLKLRLGREHAKKLAAYPAVNRTADLNVKRRRKLTRSEEKYIDAHPQLRQAYERISEA